MLPASNLLAFMVVVVPFILIPGPSVLFVLGRSLSLGRLGGLLSVLGNGVGAFVLAAGVAIGVGTIVAQSVVVFTAVKVAGAAYLIWLGVQAIRHRRERSESGDAAVRRPAWRLLLEGFVVGVTNPKSVVFFIAVLPQFVDYSVGAVPLQMLTLAAVAALTALTFDSVWALAAGAARDWFGRSPRRLSTLAATGGVFMIGLGVASLFLGSGSEKR